MTISIYIAMGLAFSAGYGLCYLLARADIRLSSRLCSKAIADVARLEDQIEDERIMFSEHRASCGYVEPLSDSEAIFEEVEL